MSLNQSEFVPVSKQRKLSFYQTAESHLNGVVQREKPFLDHFDGSAASKKELFAKHKGLILNEIKA